MNDLVWLQHYSGIATRLRPSIIRELLKAIAKPGVISFAGGLPAEEVFPITELRECFDTVLQADARSVQYSPTEGYEPLKQQLIVWLARKGIHATSEMILFTCGAQQAVTFLSMILVDRHDLVLVEEPTYPGCVSAIDLQSPAFKALPALVDGRLDMDRIEQQMRYTGCKPKLVYLVPTFANPSGQTIDQERRDILLMLSHRHSFPIIEDDPYYCLRYEGEHIPPMKALPGGDSVIYVGSFSKIVAPGIRLGYVVAVPSLISQLVILKQAVDMETSGLIQRVIAEYMSKGYLAPHIEKIKETYGERMRAMKAALKEFMPEGTRWTDVKGGMFVWVTLPSGINTELLLTAALERDVAFIPGTPFCIGGGGKSSMRLNFTNAPPSRIQEGIGRLGELVKSAVDQKSTSRSRHF